jgi:signal transduction histidine kinase
MADATPNQRPEPHARARSGRSWFRLRPGEAAYLLLGFPVALFCLAYVLVLLYAGGLLTLTVVGLPLLALGLRGARGLGAVNRAAVRVFLRTTVDAPPVLPRADGLIAWVRTGLTDPAGWRFVLYAFLRLPVAVLGILAVLGLPAAGLWMCGFPWWVRQIGDAPAAWQDIVAVPLGLFLIALWPLAVRGATALERRLAAMLLAPTAGQRREQSLRRSRGLLAAQNAERLRWIERDLHDGTQAELVAIAITLSLAADAHGDGSDDRLGRLLVRARTQTDDAIAGLRRITGGIHPAALDAGLGHAVAALAEGVPFPVEVRVDLAEAPDPAVERVVYFCVAELLTNAAKHSGTDRASVDVRTHDGRIVATVRDDGRGGAASAPPGGDKRAGTGDSGHGTGLSGLADRLAAVDGTLRVVSPPGGPTVVTAELPARI